MDSTVKSSFDVTSDYALEAIRKHRGPVLVDLDETLYLRNSTEDFIDTACPAPLAFAMLKLLELLRPWQWTGGQITRDAWRVRLICLFFPWTMILWRRRVTILASRWANRPLLKSLQDNYASTHKSPMIVTLGFMQVVRPLIYRLGLTDVKIIAMSPWRLDQRRRGKLDSVTKAIGKVEVGRSLLITDSLDDQDILEQCRNPLRVIWASAQFAEAFGNRHIPGQYLAKIKRPGQQYIYRAILREDFVFWLLCSLSMAPNPASHIAGLAFLLFSFWSIYEWGYADNDKIAASYEKKPHLSKEYHSKQVRFSTPRAWLWSGASGIAGLSILSWPAMPKITGLLAWAGVLLATYFCFMLYNRLDKLTRIWFYAILRLLRIAAFVAIVPVSAVGVAAICAYTISRWIPYLHYRTSGHEWSEERTHTSLLLFFCINCAMLGYVLGWHILIQPTAFALLSWTIFKARHELKAIISTAHRIDSHEPK